MVNMNIEYLLFFSAEKLFYEMNAFLCSCVNLIHVVVLPIQKAILRCLYEFLYQDKNEVSVKKQ